MAGVTADALTLGVGDGGNEVGMGKVALNKDVSPLNPGGEYVVGWGVSRIMLTIGLLVERFFDCAKQFYWIFLLALSANQRLKFLFAVLI